MSESITARTIRIVLLTHPGCDKLKPSDDDLARTVDELFSGADCATLPKAVLSCLRGRTRYDILADRDGTVTFTTTDDNTHVFGQMVYGIDKQGVFALWKLLARGDIAKIAAEFPQCGWSHLSHR